MLHKEMSESNKLNIIFLKSDPTHAHPRGNNLEIADCDFLD